MNKKKKQTSADARQIFEQMDDQQFGGTIDTIAHISRGRSPARRKQEEYRILMQFMPDEER